MKHADAKRFLRPMTVQFLDRWDENRYEINPKVLELVFALNQAGFVTTMSGDMYTDKLVYVDLWVGHAHQLVGKILPEKWGFCGISVAAANAWVDRKPEPPCYGYRTRLVYRGKKPTNTEILSVIRALLG